MADETLTTEQQALAARLAALEESLQDVLEERRFTLGQTGVHLGAARVASLRAAWERDEARLREEIAGLQRALAGRSGGDA